MHNFKPPLARWLLYLQYMKRHIPNTLTTLNLFSGCIAAIFAFQGEFTIVLYCLIACGVFDFLDGAAARLLNVKSKIGKELDSLADMVSFGFVPGTTVFMLLKESTSSEPVPYVAFLITVFSALRLAKFNVDDRQTSEFIGVNTPMNSFLVISLPFIAQSYPEIILNLYFLLGFVLLTSYMLVSEIRLFSMKLTDTSWQTNKFKYSFVLISLVLLLWIQFLALPFIFLGYIVFSVLHFRGQGDQFKEE